MRRKETRNQPSGTFWADPGLTVAVSRMHRLLMNRTHLGHWSHVVQQNQQDSGLNQSLWTFRSIPCGVLAAQGAQAWFPGMPPLPPAPGQWNLALARVPDSSVVSACSSYSLLSCVFRLPSLCPPYLSGFCFWVQLIQQEAHLWMFCGCVMSSMQKLPRVSCH